MKRILTLIIISSFFLIGCGEPEVKPNKQAKKIDNMVEDKMFSFEGAVRSEGMPIKSSETNKIYYSYGGFVMNEMINNKKVEEVLKKNNISSLRYIQGEYSKEGELRSLVFLGSDKNGSGYEKVYLIYGSASAGYEEACKGDKKMCEELKIKGDTTKPEYEQFLKDYGITTKELKEYFQYKYDKYVQDNPDY